MTEAIPLIDAGIFLGMHHGDKALRQKSLAFFRSHFGRQVRMNFEQVGICDAIIWKQPRQVQDDYYPFMDRLHSDMQILRVGYCPRALALAAGDARLHHLRPDRALLAAQVLCNDWTLFTHDPELHTLPLLRPRLGDFSTLSESLLFPPALEALYQSSKVYIHTDKDWENVETRYPHPLDHTA